jgi:Flp pilus assembly protein TadG
MANRAQWWSIVRDDRGTTLLEFAISASLLLMAFFGIMDFARALYAYHFVSYSAQEGSRYAMVRGNDWSGSCASASSYGCQASSANIQSFVQGLAPPGIAAANIVVTPSWPEQNADGTSTGCSTTTTENSQGCLVEVTVTYTFYFFTPSYLKTSSMTMTATSEKVIEY